MCYDCVTSAPEIYDSFELAADKSGFYVYILRTQETVVLTGICRSAVTNGKVIFKYM